MDNMLVGLCRKLLLVDAKLEYSVAAMRGLPYQLPKPPGLIDCKDKVDNVTSRRRTNLVHFPPPRTSHLSMISPRSGTIFALIGRYRVFVTTLLADVSQYHAPPSR